METMVENNSLAATNQIKSYIGGRYACIGMYKCLRVADFPKWLNVCRQLVPKRTLNGFETIETILNEVWGTHSRK